MEPNNDLQSSGPNLTFLSQELTTIPESLFSAYLDLLEISHQDPINLAENSKEFTGDFFCPICFKDELSNDGTPIMLPCGHNGCLACYSSWTQRTCALCRKSFDGVLCHKIKISPQLSGPKLTFLNQELINSLSPQVINQLLKQESMYLDYLAYVDSLKIVPQK